MGYIEKQNRGQLTFLPDCVEEYIGEDNPARVIDAFVDSLDLSALGFKRAVPDETGRPPYDPRDLLKLYLYGYFNRIRSSRRLMAECERNVELFYLMGKLRPDFRTIADFRKENAKALKGVFRAFVSLCMKLGLYQRELFAVDGTRIRAVNGKDHAFNAEVLEKKLARIEENLTEYLRRLDSADVLESPSGEPSGEEIRAAVADLRARRTKYEGYLEYLKTSGETQILGTDPEARRMHSKDGFHCCYNVQTAVDEGSHLVADYAVTNHNTDQGLLHSVAEGVKEALGLEVVHTVADKGYDSRQDILSCVMNGVVPNVGFKYDKTERVFPLEHIEAMPTQEERRSTRPADIQKCLHAGVLPDCYEGTGLSVELQYKTQMSCFLLQKDGTVMCPHGHILRRTRQRGANAIYANKGACRECQNRCTASKSYKTVSFGPNTDCIPVVMYGECATPVNRIPPDARISPYNHVLDRKSCACKQKVLLTIREDKEKQRLRMCLSEHPFGTVKWHHGAHYLLCKGKEKAGGEMGLSFLCYNLRRVLNMVGASALIAGIREGILPNESPKTVKAGA